MTYAANAIVLKRDTWRDAARSYSLYTREHGKILAVGRGTRKVLSKLAAHLEPFTSAEVLLARGRRADTICGAVMSRAHEELAAELARHEAAAFVVELYDQLLRPGERDERLWLLLEGTLASLATVPSPELRGALAGFAWRFMDCLGYRPKLEACIACERSLAFGAARFLPAAGAAGCTECVFDERTLQGATSLGSEDLIALASLFELEQAETPASLLHSALAFVEVRLDRPLATLPQLRDRWSVDAFTPERDRVTIETIKAF